MDYSQFLMAPLQFALFSLSYSLIWYYFSYIHGTHSSILPTDWPIFGTIPSLFSNRGRLMCWCLEALEEGHGSLRLKGPWLCNMDLLFTTDPADAQYVVGKRHEDFHKGANFNQIFDVLGEGIFNSDTDKWRYQRKIGHSYFTSINFRRFYVESLKEKLDGGLTPLLEGCHKEGLVVDLQDIFQRFNSDIIYKVLIGDDHNELSMDKPSNSLQKGVHEVEEALLLRHILPKPVWKLQKLLGIGKERKMTEAKEAIDDFFYKVLRIKRDEVKQGMEVEEDDHFGRVGEDPIDLLSFYMKQNYGTPNHGFESQDAFLKDTFFAFLIAGQDSMTAALTWLFWLLIKHPQVEAKIRDELNEYNFDEGFDIYELGDSKRMVYLHGAILEALRLYPPVPFNHRAAKEPTILPSGQRVNPWTMIIFATYAMGKMKWVWGEDAEEFKPERWITERGRIKHVPSHKFFAFNTGPRICLGKEMSLVQMKAVACHVLRHNYRFEIVEGHRVEMALSMVLHMKHGLKVKVMKTA